MERTEYTRGGCRITRRDAPDSEEQIFNDFATKVEIKVNGKVVNKIVSLDENVVINSPSYSPQSSGGGDVMDPATFFGNSALKDIAKKL